MQLLPSVPEIEIQIHHEKCWARKHRKRKRTQSDSESSSNEKKLNHLRWTASTLMHIDNNMILFCYLT